ncbi:MAG: Rho termination factor N-terminal domain-containing protein [Iphinoe sp. HA4291-MV1]|jgi:DNA repair exonuclease SbcCD ATPase subunit|nr:Rho termination factor N-terminal domain-containing protein [Iphinoe sp. HA4291-MV1]
MNSVESQNRIIEYLRIKPISHGQVYTFQIAVPESEVVAIPSERREQLKESFTQQGTNLIPLIVRRTEAYSEEEEYEVVYGVDWCLVAKELDIEKLWVWVFDMTDEQVVTAKEEMQQLLGSSDSTPVEIQHASEKIESIKPILQHLDKLFQQLATLNQKIEQVTASVKKLERETNEVKQTNNDDKFVQQIAESIKRIEEKLNKPPEPTPSPLQDYDRMTLSQLQMIASERSIKGRSKMKRTDLIAALKKADASN